MAEGYAMMAAATIMGVSWIALYRWAATYLPRFSLRPRACKRAPSSSMGTGTDPRRAVTRVRACIAALRMDEAYRQNIGRNLTQEVIRISVTLIDALANRGDEVDGPYVHSFRHEMMWSSRDHI